jgi:hypothetical protein
LLQVTRTANRRRGAITVERAAFGRIAAVNCGKGRKGLEFEELIHEKPGSWTLSTGRAMVEKRSRVVKIVAFSPTDLDIYPQ